MSFVVLAYVISVVEDLIDYRKRVYRKRHGSAGKTYYAASVFRYGIEKVMTYADRTVHLVRYLYGKLARAKPLEKYGLLLNV